MSYLGRSAKLSLKAQEKVSFLATAGQTSKTGLSYTPTFVEVYVNGVLLTDTTDFTATNGNSVTFTVADHYNKTEADTLLAAKSPLASPSFTGNVGIGTSSPSYKLEVISSGGADFALGEEADTARGMRIRKEDAAGNYHTQFFWSDHATSEQGDLSFHPAKDQENVRFPVTGGITFNGDTATANALDDYEEGTWTATIADNHSGGNTGSTHTGYYTKVGQLVTVRVSMNNITTSGLTSGNVLYARGLPFSSSADSGVSAQGVARPDNVNLQGARTFITTSMGVNDTWFWFSACGSAISDTSVDVGDITSGTSDIITTISYITSP